MQHNSAFLKKIKPICKNAPAFEKRFFLWYFTICSCVDKEMTTGLLTFPIFFFFQNNALLTQLN